MKNMHPPQNETRHGIMACRKRLRRTRATRQIEGRSGEARAQTANRESLLLAAEIDRHAPPRARFEGREEADAA